MKGLKAKDIRAMSKEERLKRFKELKVELVKSKVRSTKGSARTKEIKKALARFLTVANAVKKQGATTK